MKDFNDSYKQKAWASAVHRHARMKALYETTENESLKDFAKEIIDSCEKKYPELKELK